MTEQIQLDIPLVLPDIPDANDACVARLTSNLAARPGIEKAHIVPAEGDKPALLCIHYDPGILSLSRIRDIARGATLLSRMADELGAAVLGQEASLHGIEAELALRPAGAGGIGATILQACDDLGAGLLIMGAYEHSRFSEDLLGGTTKDILARAPLPVLMAH